MDEVVRMDRSCIMWGEIDWFRKFGSLEIIGFVVIYVVRSLKG